jgi:prophage DNA circulation protein
MAVIGTNADGSPINTPVGQSNNQSRGPVYVPPNLRLKKASFMNYPFPVTNVTVTGGIRDHIHEYPHADGGAPEKLGRKVYTIKMEALFYTTFKNYPYLWPTTLNYLRTYFERSTTGPLVIPTIGTIQAYCRNWTTTQDKALSGEKAELEFVEDQGSQALVQSLIEQTPTFVEKAGTYNSAMLLAEFNSTKDQSIFDAVQNAVNGVLAYSDSVQAAGNVISAKLLALADICAQADKTITAQNPMNHPVTEALKDIWATAQSTNGVFFNTQLQTKTFYVASLSSIGQVATTIYGDASRAVDLLDINPIENAFAIPAGTSIKYVENRFTTALSPITRTSL